MNVRIDADVLLALKAQNQHKIGRLATDAGKRHELLERRRHVAAKAVDQGLDRSL